jgi:uncharacterized protein (DUF983 family)
MSDHTDITFRQAAQRAVLGHCPCCGKGALFRAYLKPVENCAACGTNFGAIRSDDAAPWLTIILVGHILLPLAFIVDLSPYMSEWAAMTLWSVLFAGAALAILPRAKGLFIAILWQTHAPGFDAA